MKIRQFWNVVPKAVRVAALVVVACAVITGLVVGYAAADRGAAVQTVPLYGAAGLFGGIVVAVWLLCLGFVFADARRRAMRPVLWVSVAALFPHLLGFLLYFVLRQPIASFCTHCGCIIAAQQRFCSCCGNQQNAIASGAVQATHEFRGEMR